MIRISKKISDEEKINRYKVLKLTKEEEQELLAYDKAVERGEKTEFDATPEQLKVEREMAKTGTRKTTAYKFSKRERKPNATKGGIITELAQFFTENSSFSTENVKIVNKERQISFQIGGETYELTLVQKRKGKKLNENPMTMQLKQSQPDE